MRISKKKIISVIILLLLLIGLICGAVYLKKVADYKRAVVETTIGEIDIADVSDGIYIGEYDVNFIYAKVEVTVEDGEIVSINILEHRHERGKAAETVIEKIIEEQKIDVDAVSGATNSSTVIKKAVENALKGGL
ncbi:FMN-binding protein [Neglecta sp. X4]|uniref:FMN-binding protein n=1 Tax=unclassified Neglectibacter TaxID=2632164 RepID=UPI00136A265B|nr:MULTISPECIES: FMN-binding protein [unclassified Neglectibacter]NBI18976.1 FMN-binding protein [Neglectibacter sp. 59]NBJ74659.1 FMN-binding protein [Neglectibacter sp. X4]NCE82523.1 FMN-binding protein [Neglectibacter sp. X58]